MPDRVRHLPAALADGSQAAMLGALEETAAIVAGGQVRAVCVVLVLEDGTAAVTLEVAADQPLAPLALRGALQEAEAKLREGR